MEPSGSLWPNGEFTIGYSPCGGLERGLSPEERAAKSVPPLGLAIGANSHSEDDGAPQKRGLNGITSYGRRLVRNSVEMLERAYGVKNLGFATMTLPNLEYEEFWNVSSNWGDVVRVFYQSISRKLAARMLPPFYVGVTELQPERTARSEVPALHIHFVFVGRRRGEKGWRISPAEFREAWRSAVSRYCWGEYDWSATENVQGVRHTASGYLSKYMSKGCEGVGDMRRDGTGWALPHSWYNISLRLKRKVCEKVRRDPGLMDMMESSAVCGALDVGCEYIFRGEIQEMPGPGPHYFVGKLTKEAMDEILDIWRASK